MATVTIMADLKSVVLDIEQETAAATARATVMPVVAT